MATIQDLINTALAEEGYLEKASNSQLDSKTANAGNKDYTKYGRDMHAIYPSVMDFPAAWCDCFVDWCFYKTFGVANAKGLLGGDFNDYTVASAQLYKNKNAWYTSNPKIGDQIFFKNSTRICHTGLVVNVANGRVYTIEGNTTSQAGVVANGGCVRQKSYPLNSSYIAGYGRPNYAKYATSDAPANNTPIAESSKPNTSTNGKIAINNVVTASVLNIRKTASVNAVVLGTYTKNTKVDIIDVDSNQGWYKTNRGWISSRYVSTNTGKVTASVLNVRAGAGTNYKILTTVKNGTVLNIVAVNGDWYLTNKGWVSANYVK